MQHADQGLRGATGRKRNRKGEGVSDERGDGGAEGNRGELARGSAIGSNRDRGRKY